MGVIRKTKSVKKVLNEFSQSNHALSVVQLVKTFQAEMNKTTVYRILERLENEGTLHSFIGKDGLKWVAYQDQAATTQPAENHAHFQCQDCGISECLTVEIAIPSVPNHTIDSANLVLIGQCQNCAS